MRILIAPFSSRSPNVKRNPKEWPHWPELVLRLRKAGHVVVQLGEPGDILLPADERVMPVDMSRIGDMLREADTFVSVDTWLQHAAALHGVKGIVIWSVTDPKIFGRDMHVNLLPADADLTKHPYAVLPGIVQGLAKSEAERPCVAVDEVLAEVEGIAAGMPDSRQATAVHPRKPLPGEEDKHPLEWTGIYSAEELAKVAASMGGDAA
jgi:ADP-heptose:LPS heptosyltransferase